MAVTSSRRKLLIVLPSLNAGGTEHVRLAIAKELQLKYCWDVVFLILLSTRGQLYSKASRDFEVISFDCDRLLHGTIRLFIYLNNNRLKYNALLVGLWPLTVLVSLAHFLSGSHSKLIISEHADLASEYASNSKWKLLLLRISTYISYRLATDLFGVSNGVADAMSRLSGLKRDRIKTIPNPYQPAQLYSLSSIEAYKKFWMKDSFRLLSVGGLRPQKNYSQLIHAINDAKLANFSLVIIGDGPERASLEQLVTRLSLKDRINLLGYIEDPAPYYQAADAFVLFSLFEGFPNVLIEALGAGLQVIASDSPWGASEILDGGTYGRLVPVNNINSLRDALYQSSLLPTDVEKLISRSKQFDLSSIVNQYHNICSDFVLPAFHEKA
jgi:glycosyltransferase involved in cell wall biosynthesis